jgi:hypothetical protein
MTAKILQMPQTTRLECNACGAEAKGSCNCGVPYSPVASRAAAAIAAHPEKSNRAIAAETGASTWTVNQERKKAAERGLSPDKHVGKDGKSYPAKLSRPPAPDEDEDEPDVGTGLVDDEPDNFEAAFLLRADHASRSATDAEGLIRSNRATKELAATARRVAARWAALADAMEKSL